MTREIPEDVFEAAKAEIAKGEIAIVTVARAIMAERERSAKIAEDWQEMFGQTVAGTAIFSRLIAAAIRGTTP